MLNEPVAYFNQQERERERESHLRDRQQRQRHATFFFYFSLPPPPTVTGRPQQKQLNKTFSIMSVRVCAFLCAFDFSFSHTRVRQTCIFHRSSGVQNNNAFTHSPFIPDCGRARFPSASAPCQTGKPGRTHGTWQTAALVSEPRRHLAAGRASSDSAHLCIGRPIPTTGRACAHLSFSPKF